MSNSTKIEPPYQVSREHLESQTGRAEKMFRIKDGDQANTFTDGHGSFEWTAKEEAKVVRKIDFIVLPLVVLPLCMCEISTNSEHISLATFLFLVERFLVSFAAINGLVVELGLHQLTKRFPNFNSAIFVDNFDYLQGSSGCEYYMLVLKEK